MTSTLTASLTVDLAALVENWRALDAMGSAACETAAVVKADGYGCGAGRVGRALVSAGARSLFVATPDEGRALREAVGAAPAIYILGGYGVAEQGSYVRHALQPVLNSAEQARAWFNGPNGPAAVQIDTGMNRLGMEAHELASLGPLPASVGLIMSHMGCADDPPHPANAAQLQAFREMTEGSTARRSLSATAGHLLGPDYRFDMVRIGIGLFGGWPYENARRVVDVTAPIIQIRSVAIGESVGYGASWVAERPSKIATISAGYADGLIRALSAGATAYIAGSPVPFAGRVSMDLITLDVTGVPCHAGDPVEVLGPHQSIDTLAKAAGTIGHEILTSLGARYHRIYGA